MFPPESSPASRTLQLLAAAVAVILLTLLPVSAVEPETCFSRQHQSARVNVRLALNRPGALMEGRAVRSDRDCVLTCCSEEVKPGAKCNMAVFTAIRRSGEDNCLLFHCPTEQDCPLMKAPDGTNTYDIYKGLIHPTTVRPVTTTTTKETISTTTLAPTTPATTTTTTTTTQTSLVIVPKGVLQSDHALQNSSVGRGKAVAARGAVKSGVVAFMVLGLAVLTLALAVGGRKAMESFDRRHYTRLELNDLHYEV
ncbi:MANSC domain-containing protein 1 [Seriola lalandi dorsalis]|uniref:MANSC domain-containing protein 1 n=1 Tax=Seriola lalandi dorsalis TaxID=1841481 RepID=UPI000C6F72DC|nr:MANSC domain-containing protein 1 [Seriola lalandi dorsalis]